MQAADSLYVRLGVMGDDGEDLAQRMVVYVVGTKVLIAVGQHIFNGVWDSCPKMCKPIGQFFGQGVHIAEPPS